MTKIDTKDRLFEDAGYSYSFSRDVWVNRDRRKIFSFEFVEDHTDSEIAACLAEPSLPADEWQFYFNSLPTKLGRQHLAKIFS